MTVCIAVGCDCDVETGKNPKVILISDTLLSMGHTSSEIAQKARYLAEGWGVMYAGNDITHVPEVIDTAQAPLDKENEPNVAKVGIAMSRAYQHTRRSQIESAFLRTYNMDMDEFVAKGKDAFPQSYHLNMLYEIERCDLGCEFLVAGFSSINQKFPSFFTVQNPGLVSPLDEIGYCAIGSGAINALAYLSRRNQEVFVGYERSLYTAIAAKRLAEKAPGVGPDTNIVVLERGAETYPVRESEIVAITKMWREEEESVEPHDLEQRVAKVLGLH